MTEACRLCGSENELRNSHIIPKFVFDWMKRTGGRFLRQPVRPNVRLQDGQKERLLCADCEQRFSDLERYFSEVMFYPVLEDPKPSYAYDGRLHRFFLSVLWRAALIELREIRDDHPFPDELREAEAAWREYLRQDDSTLDAYDQVHVLITDVATNQEQPVVNLNRYMCRAVDRTVASNSSTCFMYAKFARFLVFGGVVGLDESLMVNTKIHACGGELRAPQELRNADVGSFVIDRAREASTKFQTGLSRRQQGRINRDSVRDMRLWLNSDLGRVMAADFTKDVEVDPGPTIWRNQKCRCGSGKKYKNCHGRRPKK